MNQSVQNFRKSKEYLICVDSDGCAMDTMDSKHRLCFGPCMVEEWGLQQWREEILARWNEINLYTRTRGINRFKGLAMALQEIDSRYTSIEGVKALAEWAETARELSNAGLRRKMEETPDICLEKALRWSNAVNASVDRLPEEEKLPFPGVLEGLQDAHGVADVAVVSSANGEAVLAEWSAHGLLEQVDVLLAQDAGSKAHCIAALMDKGYAPEHILMVGDAPGDQAAAAQNGVYYFPILVRREAESWQAFREEALPLFVQDGYAGYGARKEKEFWENLR